MRGWNHLKRHLEVFFQTYKLACFLFYLFIHHVSCSWQLNLSVPSTGSCLECARNGCPSLRTLLSLLHQAQFFIAVRIHGPVSISLLPDCSLAAGSVTWIWLNSWLITQEWADRLVGKPVTIADAGWFTFSTSQSFYLSWNVKSCFCETGYFSSVQEAGSNLIRRKEKKKKKRSIFALF